MPTKAQLITELAALGAEAPEGASKDDLDSLYNKSLEVIGVNICKAIEEKGGEAPLHLNVDGLMGFAAESDLFTPEELEALYKLPEIDGETAKGGEGSENGKTNAGDHENPQGFDDMGFPRAWPSFCTPPEDAEDGIERRVFNCREDVPEGWTYG